jgi:hypothetical protein
MQDAVQPLRVRILYGIFIYKRVTPLGSIEMAFKYFFEIGFIIDVCYFNNPEGIIRL